MKHCINFFTTTPSCTSPSPPLPSTSTSTTRALLHSTISPINHQITPRRIRRRIRRQIQIRPLQLTRRSLPPHRNLPMPNPLRLRRHEITNLRTHIPRRNRIHPREFHPLHRQTSTKVDDAGFRGIVRRLMIGDIRNMSAHGRRGDEAARTIILAL